MFFLYVLEDADQNQTAQTKLNGDGSYAKQKEARGKIVNVVTLYTHVYCYETWQCLITIPFTLHKLEGARKGKHGHK